MKYSQDQMYQALVDCDDTFDREFYYAVKTVGVYCRPSCHSRTPLQKNVEFFATPERAEAAGYRPCKRCRPDLLDYDPALEIAEQYKTLIDGYYGQRKQLTAEMKELGISAGHLAAIFKQQYGLAPIQYLNQVRLEHAKILLEQSKDQIAFVAYDIGFDSLAAFYRFFKKHTGTTPAKYRESRQQS